MKYRGLGKGLSALLKEEMVQIDQRAELIKSVDIDAIEPGEYQPRKIFEQDKLQELAISIQSNGLLQPIIVSPGVLGGKYRIIAGERRWRASKLAGLKEVQVIIKDISDEEILKLSLLENIQREELTVIEEAEGLARLIAEFNFTPDKLASSLGKSRSHITNLLRLNGLSSVIKDKVNDGLLTMGHARCLIGNNNAEEIAEYIIKNDLSVRQTENIVKNWLGSNTPKPLNENNRKLSANHNNPELKELVDNLSTKFNVKVSIEDTQNGGKLIFHYHDLKELDAILFKVN